MRDYLKFIILYVPTFKTFIYNDGPNSFILQFCIVVNYTVKLFQKVTSLKYFKIQTPDFLLGVHLVATSSKYEYIITFSC